jgi:hypothetical protein
MSITNTELASAVSTLIANWQTFMDEHRAWLGGVVGGGPNSDGKYPLTDDLDVTVLVKAPAQLQSDVTGMVNSASAYATAASASATAAAASATTASTQASNASSSATAAAGSATTATTQASAAASSATTASGQATAAAASAAAALASQLLAQAAAGALTDPNAYSIMTWNDGTNLPAWVTAGTALSVFGRSANSVGAPAAIAGANNQVLAISGSVLGFVSTLPAVSGANLTSLTAANVTGANTLPDGVLSTNVPLKNAANSFSANITMALANARLHINSTSGAAATTAYENAGTAKGYMGISLGTSQIIAGDAANDMVIRNEGGNILFSADSGVTAHLKLSNAGNVTTPNASSQEVGYKGCPPTILNADYTLVLSDAGFSFIFHTSAKTLTIPANASVAYPIGTEVTVANRSAGNITIAITTDTLLLSGSGTTGSRTIASNTMVKLLKTDSNVWMISSGTGVS